MNFLYIVECFHVLSDLEIRVFILSLKKVLQIGNLSSQSRNRRGVLKESPIAEYVAQRFSQYGGRV
jgi:hypothetical protein